MKVSLSLILLCGQLISLPSLACGGSAITAVGSLMSGIENAYYSVVISKVNTAVAVAKNCDDTTKAAAVRLMRRSLSNSVYSDGVVGAANAISSLCGPDRLCSEATVEILSAALSTQKYYEANIGIIDAITKVVRRAPYERTKDIATDGLAGVVSNEHYYVDAREAAEKALVEVASCSDRERR